MPRRFLALAAVILFAACQATPPDLSEAPDDGSDDGPAGTGLPGAVGASLAEAATAVKNWCALIPADLITSWAPSAQPATPGVYPGECGATNGVQALDFQYSRGFGRFETPNPMQLVSGLGVPAYAQTSGVDETQLWIVLLDTTDANAELFIDVAGHDGKDHLGDALAIAKAVLSKLK